MRLSDLLKLSFSNLKRRKTRTVLTVLGVVIGTASIVVMVSLGLGMSQAMLKSFQDSSSLTMITVVNYGGNSGSGKKKLELTDESIKSFEMLPHVIGSSPSLSVYVEARSGAYNGNLNIMGVSQDYLKQLKLKSGDLPKPKQGELSLIYGNRVGSSFYKNGDWMNPGNIDPERDTIFFSFPQGYSSGDALDSDKAQKKYLIKTAGVIEGDSESYTEYSMNIYADIDSFKAFLRRIYKKNLVPSPQLGKNGKPLRYYVYDTAYVFVDDMENVTAVQKLITDQGYSCYSNMEWLEQSQKSMGIIQLVLGGIGAVSLLVAAIGIMNTMMMSIYERTKEIGVMKVLGCDMGDIRNMFLTESAMIGVMGGIAGLVLSFAVSLLINTLAGGAGQAMFGSESVKISLIPLWLSAFAIIFAMLVGTASGYVPSLRAMKLSPLAAIRND